MVFITDKTGFGLAMSQLHDFVLIDRPLLAADESFPADDPASVRIHHELMEYIRSTLALIPVHGAWRDDGPREIDLFGVSVIRRDGAPLAARIFGAWADLLAAGPPQIELTGGYFEWVRDDDEDEPEAGAAEAAPSEEHDDDRPIVDRPALHEVHATAVPVPGDTGPCRFAIDRDEAVAALRLLAEWSTRVAADDGLYLLHGGI